jgi:hypothetical protein
MKKNMEELLKKYWDGETTLEEEKFIRIYFRGENIKPEHDKYRDLFNFFDEEKEIRYPVSNKSKKEAAVQRSKSSWMRIAAAIIVILGLSAVIYLNLEQNSSMGQDAWVKYEVQDPEKAKEMALEALAFTSSKLNKGEENVRTNLKTFNRLPLR